MAQTSKIMQNTWYICSILTSLEFSQQIWIKYFNRKRKGLSSGKWVFFQLRGGVIWRSWLSFPWKSPKRPLRIKATKIHQIILIWGKSATDECRVLTVACGTDRIKKWCVLKWSSPFKDAKRNWKTLKEAPIPKYADPMKCWIGCKCCWFWEGPTLS